MIVVADSSALLALAACDSLYLLDELFQRVQVPGAVFRECVVPDKPKAVQLEAYLCDKTIEVDLYEFIIAATGIGQGELEAMALHKRLHADYLIIDDNRARKVAAFNGITVIGSLGVLLFAKNNGLITAILPLIESIKNCGIYIGEPLVKKALRLAGEL